MPKSISTPLTSITNPPKSISVVVAIVVDGHRLFATQRGYGEFKDYWEFPGGKIEAGETREQALLREIREELNAVVTIESHLRTLEYDYPHFHLTLHCFVCRAEAASLELKEHEASRWLTADELNTVAWLPANLALLDDLRRLLR